MPLFAESVRTDRLVRRPSAELVALSKTYWRRHLKRAPANNPVLSFLQRLETDLPAMQERGLAHYHAGLSRRCGNSEPHLKLAAQNLHWLKDNGDPALQEPITAFEAISSACKTFNSARCPLPSMHVAH